ncbi:MAG: glycosyltransferase family 2 protein [Planctomycetota bacterium]
MLSIVIPVYNEAETVRTLVGRVISVEYGLPFEVILVDDASTDGTADVLHALPEEFSGFTLRLFNHESNRGKGAAVRTGLAEAKGELVVVQDADLEYNPREIPKLLRPVLEGEADVVFGSRFIGGQSRRVLYFWHSVANHWLTVVSNMFTNLNQTDMECCYKLFRREILDQITLREERFGFEPEVTAKVARLPGVRIFEVGVSYSGRTYEQGKKIGMRDGVRALWCVLKYNVWSR